MPNTTTADCSACQMLTTRPHLAGALVHNLGGCDGVPFNPGTGPVPGYVVGDCGHRVAASEWRAGFRVCERCAA